MRFAAFVCIRNLVAQLPLPGGIRLACSKMAALPQAVVLGLLT
jgi:hypothetical protein